MFIVVRKRYLFIFPINYIKFRKQFEIHFSVRYFKIVFLDSSSANKT